MQIKPHHGFKNIKFGLTEQQVINLLGEPSDKEISFFEEDNDENIDLKYKELGVILTFSSNDNYRLGTMTFLNEAFTLFDKKYIGQSESILNDKIANEISDVELEDNFEELNCKDYYSDNLGISFWIEDENIKSITIFPEFDISQEKVKWPK